MTQKAVSQISILTFFFLFNVNVTCDAICDKKECCDHTMTVIPDRL